MGFFRSAFRYPRALGSRAAAAAASSLGRADAGRGGWRAGSRARESARGRRSRDRAPRTSSARETCARAPSSPRPLPAPTHPAPTPGPLSPRAPRHPRALAHAPPRAHTWSARGKVSPAIATPGSCRSVGAVTLSPQRGDTFSPLSLPPSPRAPPPRLFFKSISPPTTTPIRPHRTFPPPSPQQQQQLQNRNKPQTQAKSSQHRRRRRRPRRVRRPARSDCRRAQSVDWISPEI